MKINKLIFGLLLFFCFASFDTVIAKSNDKKMLLIYVTLNDVIQINSKDTNWLSKDNCFELHIDTIYLKEIKEVADSAIFIYRNKVFKNNQLFELKKINYLSKFKIKSFSIEGQPQIIKPFENIIEINCISNELKKYLIDYWINAKQGKKEIRKTIYFKIFASDEKGKKIFELNNVEWHVTARLIGG